jgi:hypothetical protein
MNDFNPLDTKKMTHSALERVAFNPSEDYLR